MRAKTLAHLSDLHIGLSYRNEQAARMICNALLVRRYYRGPSQERLSDSDRDVTLIKGGRLEEPEMRRLQVNAGELIARAHERGFDTLGEIDSAVLYPNGTIYFRGRHPDEGEQRHRSIMERLDHLQRELMALRR